MPEYEFELERSPYFKNRSELLKSNRTPKLSDAKANLGDVMAKVMFDKCEEALRDDFGLTVPLKGPGNILWVSPSDLLIGKIALKPPFTPKCLQALTHKGILEIGQDLENKFKHEMEIDKQMALENYKEELLAAVEDHMKLEIKDVEIRERLNCHMEMEKLQQDFELVLKEELDTLEKKIREQYEEIISSHESTLKAKWEDRLQEEVKKTVDSMTKKYLTELDQQQEKLIQIFETELKKQEMLKEFNSRLHKRKIIEALRQLKHNLECTNLVNMMYILCIERRKCCDKIAETEKRWQNEVEKLKNRLKEKDQLIEKVTAEKEQEIQEVSIRETCLREVIRHFQKFINFALRAAPTQAEFLLSVEKMMVFELTNEVVNLDMKKSRETDVYIPWTHEGKSNASSVKVSGLEIQDYHDCLRELNPPIEENAKGELGENDVLPAMYYKNKTYVREDFRDMLSAGVTISPSNELWNKDVEILVASWRKDHDAEQSVSADEKISMDEKERGFSRAQSFQSERRRSNKSTVQFSMSDDIEENRHLSLTLEPTKVIRKTSLKLGSLPLVEEVPLQSSVDVPKIGTASILAARDSVDIVLAKQQRISAYDLPLIQKESEDRSAVDFGEGSVNLLAESKPSVGKELGVEVRDSVIWRMSEMAKNQSLGDFITTPRDSVEIIKQVFEHDLKQASSKLSSARNSVDILRESIHKMKIPSQICQRNDSKKQEQKKDRTGFTRICCDRCKRKENVIESALFDEWSSMGDERSVRISHVQIFNLEDNVQTPSVVSFDNEPVIVKETATQAKRKIVTKAKQTPQTGRQKLRRKRKKYTPVNYCNVAGDKASNEADQSIDEFTEERIHSLIKIMSDHPFLMQLFTAGIR